MPVSVSIASTAFDPDLDGTERANLQEARLEALVFAGASVRDKPELGWEGEEMRVRVTDGRGAMITTVIIRSIDAKDARSP